LAAALATCALTGCKDKDKDKDKGDVAKAPTGAGDFTERCTRLAKACGDTDKHIEKILEECKQATMQLAAKGCGDKTLAVYDCYEKDLCGTAGKVWTLDDLRVLSERHNKCTAERTARAECAAK
jgi:hypothetical protein